MVERAEEGEPSSFYVVLDADGGDVPSRSTPATFYRRCSPPAVCQRGPAFA